MIEIFFIAWLSVIAAQASPGPNMVAVASVAATNGRKSALIATLGISVGVAIWALVVATVHRTVALSLPEFIQLLQLIGGAYLLYVGFKALNNARHMNGENMVLSAETKTKMSSFLHGLLVVLTNPKAVMMWVGVFAYVQNAGCSDAKALFLAPLAMTSAILIYGSQSVFFSSSKVSRATARYTLMTYLLIGLLYSTIGLMLLADLIGKYFI